MTMLETPPGENGEKLNITRLTRYYEERLEALFSFGQSRRGCSLQEWTRDRPLKIEKLDAKDPRCDARYPRGCWSLLTFDGLRLASDAEDEKGTYLLLAVVADHVACNRSHGSVLKKICANACLWADYQGKGRFVSLFGDLCEASRAFRLHAVPSESLPYQLLDMEFAARLGLSEQDVPVNIKLRLAVHKHLVVTRRQLHLGSVEDDFADRSLNDGATENRQEWRLHFDLKEPCVKPKEENRPPALPLLCIGLESQAGRSLQSCDLPLVLPLSENDDGLMSCAININYYLSRVQDFDKMEGEEDFLEFFLHDLTQYASSGDWENGAFSNKPAWNSAEIINKVLADKRASRVLERHMQHFTWSQTLAHVCMMRPTAQRDQCISKIAKRIACLLNHSPFEHRAEFLAELLSDRSETYLPSCCDAVLNTLSDSPELDALFKKCMGSYWYDWIPKCLIGDVAPEFMAHQDGDLDPNEKLLTQFFGLPASEAAAKLIQKRLLEKMPFEGVCHLERLMHEKWGASGMTTRRTIGEQFPGFNSVLSQYIGARRAQKVLHDMVSADCKNHVNASLQKTSTQSDSHATGTSQRAGRSSRPKI